MKIFKWIKRTLFGIFILVILLLMIGFIFEQISRSNAENLTPHGEFADVGGHRLHYYKKGEDNPTVVFESAFDPAGHLQWFNIQQEISKFATTISYDRSGLLWSERGNNPKTGKAMAEELHALLEKSGVSKPYILVGHSLGGIILRSFISKYPQEIRGVILIESACPNEEDYLSDELYNMVSQSRLPSGFLKFANSVGLVRLMFKGAFPDKEEYNYLNTLMPALLYKSAYGVLEEQDQMPFLDKEANKIKSFGNIPLYVLSASDSDRFDSMITDEKIKNELIDALAEMQKDLLKLSTDSEQVLVPNSSHYINEDQPEVIIKAVKNMILKTNQSNIE